MTLYARIQDGLVAELFTTASDISQMFHPDLVWIDVTSVTPAPQEGWSFTAPSSFSAPPAPPPPTALQLAAKALNAGCEIASTASPAALNGTYAIDPATQGKLASVAIYVQINGKFPGSSGTSMTWPDLAGNAHLFSTTASFLAFASAIANYVALLDEVITGQTTTLPAQPATIA